MKLEDIFTNNNNNKNINKKRRKKKKKKKEKGKGNKFISIESPVHIFVELEVNLG